MSASEFTVLHYVGYDTDAGGIVSVVRSLASARRFPCVLGVNRGFKPTRLVEIPFAEFASIAGEQISLGTVWRARSVAREVRSWLGKDSQRVYHGHSRAGLLVALWLQRMGERRVVVSVHCYGHQKWFYRWAARRLPGQLFWLSPAMKQYYGLAGADASDWTECIPGCVPLAAPSFERKRRDVGAGVRLAGVGALVSWKRWELILDALAAVPDEIRRKLRFIHIGGPQSSRESKRYAAALRERTTALRLDDRVEWRGAQSTADDLLRESDALVIAAEREPFSVAMIEALVAGVPVLAADSGGARDIVTAMSNGWLFRSGDSGDLAGRLRTLVESDALQEARIDPESLQRFFAPTVADQWLAVYRRVSARD